MFRAFGLKGLEGFRGLGYMGMRSKATLKQKGWSPYETMVFVSDFEWKC